MLSMTGLHSNGSYRDSTFYHLNLKNQLFLICYYLPKYLGKLATALIETVPVSKELKTIKYQARVSGRSQSSSSEIDDKHARIQRACQLLATNRLTIF
ncbi:hypothetical protein [Cysteiniphilum litorale]|uniref:hypothetical protein n=1 Tax=Cysteiniphilum litorale TaxID=2056700 RepID=UPI003F884E89